MRILMIGGTTFFGKAIVDDLLARGHRVTIFTRGRRRPGFWDLVERIQGDRTDVRGVQKKLRGKEFDAVIDNIAFSGEDVRSALGALQGRLGRYVLTSTAAVRWIPASSAAAGWRCERGKLEAEGALRSQTEVPYAIIRPPVVLGPDDPDLRGYFYFQRLLDGKPLILTNGGEGAFPLVYSRDLARAYSLVLEKPCALNQTYHVAQKELASVAELVRHAGRALGLAPRIAAIAAQTLKKIGFDYPEPYARESGPPLDTGKAERELGFAPTALADWIAATVRWYRDLYQGPDSAGYERRDREVELATKWK